MAVPVHGPCYRKTSGIIECEMMAVPVHADLGTPSEGGVQSRSQAPVTGCGFAVGVIMYIGEVVKRTGASHKAIRLYESLGLLGKIQRLGVYRVYSEKNLRQVMMIRQAQALGFRLAELDTTLRAGDGDVNWQHLIQQMELKSQSIQAEIRRLNQLDLQLNEIKAEVASCLVEQPLLESVRCGAVAF